MIFNAFQRDDDDSVFTIVRNVSGAQRLIGSAVVWDISASVDGVRVTVPATATLSLFRGVLAETINDSAYGKCQVHGYCGGGAIVSNDTSNTIVGGTILKPVNAQSYLVYGAASDGTTGLVYAAEGYAINTSAATTLYKKVLIRAL